MINVNFLYGYYVGGVLSLLTTVIVDKSIVLAITSGWIVLVFSTWMSISHIITHNIYEELAVDILREHITKLEERIVKLESKMFFVDTSDEENLSDISSTYSDEVVLINGLGKTGIEESDLESSDDEVTTNILENDDGCKHIWVRQCKGYDDYWKVCTLCDFEHP
jgi:hypothetical protein